MKLALILAAICLLSVCESRHHMDGHQHQVYDDHPHTYRHLGYHYRYGGHPHLHAPAEVRRGPAGHSHLERLYLHLFDHYHREVRPCALTDCSDSTVVKFTMTPLSSYLSFEHNKLYSNYWLKFSYTDPRLSWDPEDFGNLNQIRVPQDHVWLPDVELFNNAYGSSGKPYADHLLVVIYSSGMVLLVPTGASKTICQFNHTETEQRCDVKFGSWTYPEAQVDVQVFDDEVTPPECELKYYSGTGNEHWKMRKCEVHRHSRVYDCCPEDHYVDVTFSFHFTGREPHHDDQD